jgi:hypothetical protein
LADADGVAITAGGGSAGALDAIAFGVAADLVYNVFSATNSSPQTTELFAGDRAGTLWKYVRLGGVQSAILIAIMAYRGRTGWAVFGGLLAGGFMWGMYAHALKAGGAKTGAPDGGPTAGRSMLSWNNPT